MRKDPEIAALLVGGSYFQTATQRQHLQTHSQNWSLSLSGAQLIDQFLGEYHYI